MRQAINSVTFIAHSTSYNGYKINNVAQFIKLIKYKMYDIAESNANETTWLTVLFGPRIKYQALCRYPSAIQGYWA